MAANVLSSSDRRPGSAGEGANDLPASESPQHEEEVNREDMKEGKQKEEEDREEDRAELKENNVPTDAEKEEKEQEREQQQEEEEEEEKEASAPPLPDEEVPPPLPNEAPPGQTQDDGWEPVWDANALAYYFYNRFTGISQWENPRMPEATSTSASASTAPPPPPGMNTSEETSRAPAAGGYNPAIHGDYDPTAPYAQQYEQQHNPEAFEAGFPGIDPNSSYVVAGSFNRFTGRWQPSTLAPENYNEENKSHRQMRAFFDVDAAANSHNGRSLKAERSGKKLSKKELKAFRDKRRDKKEEKRRAWLRD